MKSIQKVKNISFFLYRIVLLTTFADIGGKRKISKKSDKKSCKNNA